MISNSILLPTSYFGNLEFYSLLFNSTHATIDHHEQYLKQSFRNRAVILTANGPQNLSIPVIRPKGKNSITLEIEVSYAENWVKDHVKAIESAYRNTPYFEFYAPAIFQILKCEHKFLHELNFELMVHLIAKIGLSVNLSPSIHSPAQIDPDYRKTIHPKSGSAFSSTHYIQTFEERHGFYPNPSIVDLLFNEGPNAISILQESKLLSPL